ncbi:MAG: hypothetical protein QOI14_894, partial [Actinomycetota bacterium]|nr:hypothetical protein [Actinomycetota bacterium]
MSNLAAGLLAVGCKIPITAPDDH